VRADGRARIVRPGEAEHARAVELLCARYAQYAERPPEQEVIAIDVERWSGWSASAQARLIAPGLAHLDLVVSSLERSIEFYGGLLEPLGWRRRSEIVGERGERVVYLGIPGRLEGSLGLRERQGGGVHDRYALGVHHVCFNAASREVVDACHEWLRSAGATIESAPRTYDYTPGYYAVFFYDPDGIKLEVLNRIPPASSPRR
jgi:catechol 2,3-dioxygenase-like lactoylglutathione lyase family enzyme